jgi:hypothetical protein
VAIDIASLNPLRLAVVEVAPTNDHAEVTAIAALFCLFAVTKA